MYVDYLVWVFYFAPALLLLVYAYRKLSHHKKSSRALADAREAKLTDLTSIHPAFDLRSCIGCGGCVTACPEGDVIGLIDRRPHLVNPTSCIGHGACREACPTGSISLVFGSLTRGVELPYVNANFETNVPGVYIAGELGGMGLIRNAIEQGRQAIESIRKSGRTSKGKSHHDVIIVGAGPAGISASLGAIAHKLNYVTLEQDDIGGTVAHYPRGKIVMAGTATLPLAGKIQFKETSKETLITLWHQLVKTYRVTVNANEQMLKVQIVDGGFVVETTKQRYLAANILLAIGRRGSPRKLSVPGEELNKVVYRLSDPEQYLGKKVLVVGGGDSALEAACSIAEQQGTTVTLSYRGDGFSRAKPKNRQRVSQIERAGRLRVLLRSNVQSIHEDSVTIESHGNLSYVANDFVIINAGGVLPTNMLSNLGIQIETKYGTS